MIHVKHRVTAGQRGSVVQRNTISAAPTTPAITAPLRAVAGPGDGAVPYACCVAVVPLALGGAAAVAPNTGPPLAPRKLSPAVA
jgi:hypothetical protein